jgi:taurine dioxygenase
LPAGRNKPANTMTVDVSPFDGALGAEVGGVDLSIDLDGAIVRHIRAAWRDHLVLLFRGQDLQARHLSAFGRRFGDLDSVPAWDGAHPDGEPELLVVSNVEQDGKLIGVLGSGEAEWHSDMSYLEKPPTASVLYGVEVPDAGGDTGFLNMYTALDELPGDLRQAIEGRSLNHASSYDSTGKLRPGAKPVGDVSEAPGAHHPIIRKHPESGREALYLGRRNNAHVVGKTVADSDSLLNALWVHATRDRYTWTQKWRPGDVLMWDNRCTMHRRSAFDAKARRIMYRAQIKGDKPV